MDVFRVQEASIVERNINKLNYFKLDEAKLLTFEFIGTDFFHTQS